MREVDRLATEVDRLRREGAETAAALAAMTKHRDFCLEHWAAAVDRAMTLLERLERCERAAVDRAEPVSNVAGMRIGRNVECPTKESWVFDSSDLTVEQRLGILENHAESDGVAIRELIEGLKNIHRADVTASGSTWNPWQRIERLGHDIEEAWGK